MVQVSLIVTIVMAGVFSSNKRTDDLQEDMNRRFDEIMRRLDRIEAKLDGHDARITRLEDCAGVRLTPTRWCRGVCG